MVAYYRLSELGYALAPGPQLLAPEAVEPVAAATGLLREAEARAAAIVRAAEDAYARRSDEGYADGLARAKLAAVERLLEESAALDAGLRATEAEMARIVAACLRKLVDDYDDQARIQATVRGALRQMRREQRSELRVSSAQFAAVKAGIDRIVAEFPDVELVDVVEDAALVPPQIVLESPVGRVEVEFGMSLAALEAVIRSVAAAEPPASADAA